MKHQIIISLDVNTVETARALQEIISTLEYENIEYTHEVIKEV